jgi:hypothetical protein
MKNILADFSSFFYIDAQRDKGTKRQAQRHKGTEAQKETEKDRHRGTEAQSKKKT